MDDELQICTRDKVLIFEIIIWIFEVSYVFMSYRIYLVFFSFAVYLQISGSWHLV